MWFECEWLLVCPAIDQRPFQGAKPLSLISINPNKDKKERNLISVQSVHEFDTHLCLDTSSLFFSFVHAAAGMEMRKSLTFHIYKCGAPHLEHIFQYCSSLWQPSNICRSKEYPPPWHIPHSDQYRSILQAWTASLYSLYVIAGVKTIFNTLMWKMLSQNSPLVSWLFHTKYGN